MSAVMPIAIIILVLSGGFLLYVLTGLYSIYEKKKLIKCMRERRARLSYQRKLRKDIENHMGVPGPATLESERLRALRQSELDDYQRQQDRDLNDYQRQQAIALSDSKRQHDRALNEFNRIIVQRMIAQRKQYWKFNNEG